MTGVRLSCVGNAVQPAFSFAQVNGGYDFPGSNSGIDLFALTGWLPEQVNVVLSYRRVKIVAWVVFGLFKYCTVLYQVFGNSIEQYYYWW